MSSVRRWKISETVDIHLVTNENQARKLISKPKYKHRTIFSEDLSAIHMKKTKLVFTKPLYLGMCIHDLKGYSSGQSHFSEIIYNVKLADKNEFAIRTVQRCLECVKISKNRVFLKISDKKSSTSDVENFHQWRNLRKKFCFRFKLLERRRLGRIFLLKQTDALRTDNLTGYIYLL